MHKRGGTRGIAAWTLSTAAAGARRRGGSRRSSAARSWRWSCCPGARLSEQDIAARHGVSRQPVREALIALAKTRLVEVLPQRGTIVVKISVKKMMEARFVREAIETAVVRRACEDFDPQTRLRIDDLLDLQEKVARRDDHVAFQRYDELFHIALPKAPAARSPGRRCTTSRRTWTASASSRCPEPSAMLPLVEQHRAIMAAIDARDGDAAGAAMHHHLTEILRALPRLEAEHAELFE